MNTVLVDTNIVVMMIRGDEKYETFTGYLEGKKQVLSFATIAEIELWFIIGSKDLPHDARSKWDEFTSQCEVVHTSAGLAFKTAQLAYYLGKKEFRQHWSDIWIAATALELGIPLVTDNVVDFKKFERLGLQVLSP